MTRHTKYDIRYTNKGLTLVEVLIVVAILGILAAITAPQLQGHTQKAKEATAKESLQMLRTAIERYAVDHDGIPPGYPSNNPSNNPTSLHFKMQLIDVGSYLSKMPENPFNDRNTLTVKRNTDSFPENATGSSGWIYKPATKEIRLDWPSTDSEGKSYFEY